MHWDWDEEIFILILFLKGAITQVRFQIFSHTAVYTLPKRDQLYMYCQYLCPCDLLLIPLLTSLSTPPLLSSPPPPPPPPTPPPTPLYFLLSSFSLPSLDQQPGWEMRKQPNGKPFFIDHSTCVLKSSCVVQWRIMFLVALQELYSCLCTF